MRLFFHISCKPASNGFIGGNIWRTTTPCDAVQCSPTQWVLPILWSLSSQSVLGTTVPEFAHLAVAPSHHTHVNSFSCGWNVGEEQQRRDLVVGVGRSDADQDCSCVCPPCSGISPSYSVTVAEVTPIRTLPAFGHLEHMLPVPLLCPLPETVEHASSTQIRTVPAFVLLAVVRSHHTQRQWQK